MEGCVFCSIPPSRKVAESSLTLTIRDAYPVSPGHTLLVTKRHVADLFGATPAELSALMDALHVARTDLEREFRPDGFNVGVNCGAAAGQTISHLHVHLIPRFHGDMPDPRGGIRHCIFGKGSYPSADE